METTNETTNDLHIEALVCSLVSRGWKRAAAENQVGDGTGHRRLALLIEERERAELESAAGAIRAIADAAIDRIGRTRMYWYEAVRIIPELAREAGCTGELLHWADPGVVAVIDHARAYVHRYVQAYGPMDSLIDVGGHIHRGRRPSIVTVEG